MESITQQTCLPARAWLTLLRTTSVGSAAAAAAGAASSAARASSSLKVKASTITLSMYSCGHGSNAASSVQGVFSNTSE
jgi:hypothetical protein